MLKNVMICALLALVTVGCGGPRYVDYFPYHDDGVAKPKVALMPIRDSSDHALSWNISEEIAEGIYYELMNSGEFYAVSPKEIGPVWQKSGEIDFFSSDTSYVREFRNTDFIVAMEVIERSVVPCDPCTQRQTPAANPRNLVINVAIRVKILDVRYCEPKIVLYEVFRTNYAGTPDRCGPDGTICWKEEGYSRSFCGRGHQRVIHQLAQRLEEVIWSAK